MMQKKKVAVVFGTRPEAIKMAPVIKELEKNAEQFETLIISTAQHREMLDQVLSVFDIQPHYDLDIMKPNQSLSDVTASAIKGLEKVYTDECPDMVLVHGDTTTSYVAALSAFYLKIPIGHVEAGLRTNDKYFPFPEEMNRQMIDSLSDLYFVPTEQGLENLKSENKNMNNVVVTGNTAIDAVHITQRIETNHPIVNMMTNDKKWILLTMHRRENYGKAMDNVFKGIKRIVEEHPDVEIVFPVHMSPIIQSHVKEMLTNNKQIHLLEPLEVDAFHKVVGKSTLVLTDSGGIQEEAPSLNVPVLVLRSKTERPEGVKSGTIKVIGTEEENVYEEVNTLLNDKKAYQNMASAKNPYGDGKASQKIVRKILKHFSSKEY